MKTVFVGGSRRISRLPAEAQERLQSILAQGLRIVVGDADGVDRAVQQSLLDAQYQNVTVFCSGKQCRNRLGPWETRHVLTESKVKGFQFFAVKDREMAQAADFGLMIWDGKSAGTVLNVLRLIRDGKKAVLLNVATKDAVTFKSAFDWQHFLAGCSADFRRDLQERATPEEWAEPPMSAVPAAQDVRTRGATRTSEEWVAEINAALAAADPASVANALGSMARDHGMSAIAKETGLARESLYRSLTSGGNPELATALRVMASLGLRLAVSKAQ